jgi:hypothetical protein
MLRLFQYQIMTVQNLIEFIEGRFLAVLADDLRTEDDSRKDL